MLPEWVAGYFRNQWPDVSGMGGRMLRNTQLLQDKQAMKGCKKLSVLLCIVTAITVSQYASANNCSAEDRKYAEFWDNYYTPQEAYNIGKILQLLVANKDTRGLYNYIDGELQNGPRRSYALNKPFDQVFPKQWSETVLSDEPPCSPVGWRGFMLGHGNIWFNKKNGEWKIRAINGSHNEVLTTPSDWSVNDKVIHPLCFSYPWMSGDNFEEFAEQFTIKNISQLLRSPGIFFGNKIDNFNPIQPGWCEKNDCQKIALINSFQQCIPEKFSYESHGHGISVTLSDKSGSTIEHSYSLIKSVSTEKCSKLAPDIGAQCKESYLLMVGDYSGGSMGWDMSTGIFGLFDLPDMGLSMVPLRFFQNKNEGLNYLENQ